MTLREFVSTLRVGTVIRVSPIFDIDVPEFYTLIGDRFGYYHVGDDSINPIMYSLLDTTIARIRDSCPADAAMGVAFDVQLSIRLIDTLKCMCEYIDEVYNEMGVVCNSQAFSTDTNYLPKEVNDDGF